jgi:hypothetical protein
MKSIKFIFILSTVCIAMSSCKKDYNCVCEHTVIFPAYTNVNNQYVPQEIVNSTYSNTISSKKKNAASDCKLKETASIQTYTSAQGQGPIETITQCGLQ